ncbi:hypothetical protein KFE25_009819 [Diacronema lutheri]|uniref:Uncharacterized protein n=1 Tax=Diacronema lutheri TaxID=2081491 RepID=A0A8J5X7I5_DIALT|nr:hypothetical protein KFE25_009819 [Diacronema lutheri]
MAAPASAISSPSAPSRSGASVLARAPSPLPPRASTLPVRSPAELTVIAPVSAGERPAVVLVQAPPAGAGADAHGAAPRLYALKV